MAELVYLDHNATTPMRAEALAAMADAAARCGNPSSVHRAGRTARQLLDAARDQVAEAVGLPPGGDIVFTSGGTEANSLALNGQPERRILVGATEHDSVRLARPDAAIVPVRPDGRLDLDRLAVLLGQGGPTIISVMAANNETGILADLPPIVALAHEAGALVHCDAIQALGKMPFDMASLGLDMVSVSAHKLGGPLGMGALAVAEHVPLAAIQRGGGQEKGLRAGTENLPGIVGFGVAAQSAMRELDAYGQLAAMRDGMEQTLLEIAPDATVIGLGMARLPNTSCVALASVASDVQVMALDLDGICVSAGSACSSGKVRPSHVLEAMGASPSVARSAIRISLGRGTTQDDLDRLVAAWASLVRRTAGRRSAS